MVRFSPWGYGSRDEVWRGLVLAVHGALAAAAIDVPGSTWAKLKQLLASAASYVESLAAVDDRVAAARALASPLVRSWTTFGYDDLKNLPASANALAVLEDGARV